MEFHQFEEQQMQQGFGVEVPVDDGSSGKRIMKVQAFEEEQMQPGFGVEVPVDADSSVKSELEKKEELEIVRRRLKEIEEEASNLRAKYELAEPVQEVDDFAAAAGAALAEKAEVDSRSIFVGNVDYKCTAEEVQDHFRSCGTVNRVTIMSDGFGNPKGFAYVEFVETEAVQNALLLNETELYGRLLKVSLKRTNVPGMKQYRGRPFLRMSYVPGPPFFPSYGYGRFPRYRHFIRYSPY